MKWYNVDIQKSPHQLFKSQTHETNLKLSPVLHI